MIRKSLSNRALNIASAAGEPDDKDVFGNDLADAMLPRVSISERHSSVSSSPGGSHGQGRSSSVSAGRGEEGGGAASKGSLGAMLGKLFSSSSETPASEEPQGAATAAGSVTSGKSSLSSGSSASKGGNGNNNNGGGFSLTITLLMAKRRFIKRVAPEPPPDSAAAASHPAHPPEGGKRSSGSGGHAGPSWGSSILTTLSNLAGGGGGVSFSPHRDFFPEAGDLTGGFGLEDVLRSRQATQALLAYATEKFACPEKVKFLVELSEYEALPEGSEARGECKRLINVYIRKGASNDIGLGYHVRQSTLTRAEAYLGMMRQGSKRLVGDGSQAAQQTEEEETVKGARVEVFLLAKSDVRDYLTETVLPSLPESTQWTELVARWERASGQGADEAR